MGVASLNTHGCDDRPSRGVLGLLSSMPRHDCDPNALLRVGPAAAGSVLSLYTLRDVAAGEPLSISYAVRYAPTVVRRRQLLLHSVS